MELVQVDEGSDTIVNARWGLKHRVVVKRFNILFFIVVRVAIRVE